MRPGIWKNCPLIFPNGKELNTQIYYAKKTLYISIAMIHTDEHGRKREQKVKETEIDINKFILITIYY